MAGLCAVDRDCHAIKRSGRVGFILAGVPLPNDGSRRLARGVAIARYGGGCNGLTYQQDNDPRLRETYHRIPLVAELRKIPFRFEPSNH
jgi:hypothetical protein